MVAMKEANKVIKRDRFPNYKNLLRKQAKENFRRQYFEDPHL